DELYQRFAAQRLSYGPSYRNIDDVISDPEAATATWTPPVPSGSRTRIGVEAGQVVAVDGVLQVADVLGESSATIRMPAYIAQARLALVDDPSPAQRVHVRTESESESTVAGTLWDDQFGPTADLAGIRFQAVAGPPEVA